MTNDIGVYDPAWLPPQKQPALYGRRASIAGHGPPPTPLSRLATPLLAPSVPVFDGWRPGELQGPQILHLDDRLHSSDSDEEAGPGPMPFRRGSDISEYLASRARRGASVPLPLRVPLNHAPAYAEAPAHMAASGPPSVQLPQLAPGAPRSLNALHAGAASSRAGSPASHRAGSSALDLRSPRARRAPQPRRRGRGRPPGAPRAASSSPAGPTPSSPAPATAGRTAAARTAMPPAPAGAARGVVLSPPAHADLPAAHAEGAAGGAAAGGAGPSPRRQEPVRAALLRQAAERTGRSPTRSRSEGNSPEPHLSRSGPPRVGPAPPPAPQARPPASLQALGAVQKAHSSPLPPPHPPSDHVVPRAAWGEVQLLRQIGSGATADVYEGEWRGQRVAVKRFLYRCEEFTREEVERFRNEAAVLERLRHAAVARLLAVGDRPPHLFLLTELCPAGTLADALRARADAGRRFTAGEAAAVGAAVARALAYLHSRQPRVVHRDVKPENVLLGADGEWRLADFGSAVALGGEAGGRGAGARRVLPCEGSLAYMAPEVLRGEPADERVDLYALAVLLYEAASGRRPGAGPGPLPLDPLAVAEGRRPPLEEALEGPALALAPLIRALWDDDPDMRPPAPHAARFLEALAAGASPAL
eukprot:tig00001065_g6737.t1